jgi:hypothetical protein
MPNELSFRVNLAVSFCADDPSMNRRTVFHLVL